MSDLERLRAVLAKHVERSDATADPFAHAVNDETRALYDESRRLDERASAIIDASGLDDFDPELSYSRSAAIRFALWLLNNPAEAVRVIEGEG